MNDKEKIVTRFAPSPTGKLHIGGARTALYNYLFARQQNGTYLLRIEDTDKERSKPEFEKNILDSLAWLGITHDAVSRQSDRVEIYRSYLETLLSKNLAYVSREIPTEQNQRSEVIRLRNPNKSITFHDIILGDITYDTTELGDIVIAKDLDTPLYHFANVVDDHEMGVTHVIRGQEHVSNTPRQILIQEALGIPTFLYAHAPLILAPDRSKLSKRHGSFAVSDYRDRGYLPEALLNFMILLGWSPGADREIISPEELLREFSLERVQKSGAVYNAEKLDWINKQYLKSMPIATFAEAIRPSFSGRDVSRIAPLVLERINKFSDINPAEFEYFFTPPSAEPSLLKTPAHLPRVIALLEGVPAEGFTPEAVKAAVWDFATEQGRGNVLWPFRVALTGRERSPDPFLVASLLGKEETLSRLRHACAE